MQKYFTYVNKMLVERIETIENTTQYFNRRYSFTEKSKQRLELYRRRSLRQYRTHGRSSKSE